MFTGIVQGVGAVIHIVDQHGIRTLTIQFPVGFCTGLEIGASVAVDGVCLTVTEIISITEVKFDVILKSLSITTLNTYQVGENVNVERATREGAEIGGHPLSGHIDFKAEIVDIVEKDGNCKLHIAIPQPWQKYMFTKGYIAVNGVSLTIADVNKSTGWIEIWLIPETRRQTTFESKKIGCMVNIEIERNTQIIVDTIESNLEKNFNQLLPVLNQLFDSQGIDIRALIAKDLN